MRLTDTTPQEVVLALRSTGASDEDVLYAAKTEFAAPFRALRTLGVCLVALGLLVSLTGIGALLGIPIAGAGIWIWLKGARNLRVIESAFAEYRPGLSLPVPSVWADYTEPSRPVADRAHLTRSSDAPGPRP